MNIQRTLDVVNLSHKELQEILVNHIETVTGRKVLLRDGVMFNAGPTRASGGHDTLAWARLTDQVAEPPPVLDLTLKPKFCCTNPFYKRSGSPCANCGKGPNE